MAVIIVIGGFAGSGKTTVTRRLAAELRLPRLASDTIGHAVRASDGVRGAEANAYWIAYDILFALCEEFVTESVSVILDMTMGWAFQWTALDAITDRNPSCALLPILLHCPLACCLDRIRGRHRTQPDRYDPPETYTDPKNRAIWEFLTTLDRPDLHRIAADRDLALVYADVRRLVTGSLAGLQAAGREARHA